MSRKSRDKGKTGERQVSRIFTASGHSVLALQRNKNDLADMLVDQWLYVDAKFQERWKLKEWIAQVEGCAPKGTVPAVAFRSSDGPWGIWTPLLDFVERMP